MSDGRNYGMAWQCPTCHGSRSHQPDCPDVFPMAQTFWDEPDVHPKPPPKPLVWPEFNDPKSGDAVGGNESGDDR